MNSILGTITEWIYIIAENSTSSFSLLGMYQFETPKELEK